MAVCPKCGVSFSYAKPHVCEGRDKSKLWLFAFAVIGTLVGGLLGWRYGNSLIRQACERPDASNLCGLPSAYSMPFYLAVGAVIGASVSALLVVVILRRRR